MKEQLEQIWSKNYLDYLPKSIRERGFNYSVNVESKDILITGINPSFRKDADNKNCFDFRIIAEDEKYDRYWSSLKKIVYDKELSIDFRSRTTYLDIFYFRETDQNFLQKQILKKIPEGLNFAVDQIKLTQEVIEIIIKPKLIIVKNKESAAYWGKYADKGLFWMGYELELLQSLESGELYKIIGLIDSEERVFPEIKKSNLENSLIFFTQHFQYTPKTKRPNAMLVNDFLNIQSRLS